MKQYRWWVGGWVALALPAGVRAQVPVGDGLQGAYFAGANFEQYVATRRDATLNFDWHGHRPVAGVGAEQFSVRWTGWLVPPTTGRYVLHLSVDDGIRFWLDERSLLDDWYGQGLSYYQVAVELHAGQAYPVRLDYSQTTAATRVRLAWELPAASAAPSTEHPRRGTVSRKEEAVLLASRYLFSSSPPLPLVPVRLKAATPGSSSPPHGPPAAPTSVRVEPARAEVLRKPKLRSYLALVAPRSLALPAPVRGDSPRVASVAAHLAAGKRVTLPALYFAQGQASLLPAVQASLDTLAQDLATYPTLRLQVQGHTDNQGDPAINQRLSQQRAAAVCTYLVAHGVAGSRLRPVGYGGARPVADNTQPSQRPRNRRVVLQPLGR